MKKIFLYTPRTGSRVFIPVGAEIPQELKRLENQSFIILNEKNDWKKISFQASIPGMKFRDQLYAILQVAYNRISNKYIGVSTPVLYDENGKISIYIKDISIINELRECSFIIEKEVAREEFLEQLDRNSIFLENKALRKVDPSEVLYNESHV